MEKLILEKLEQSENGRERFVTTDLNILKAVRELGNQGLVQWKVKMQPAQPLGLTVHDDQLNVVSDWAEKMVCKIIGAEQTAWNCKGHDGVLKSTGEKIEVKHVGWAFTPRTNNYQFSFRGLSLDEFDVLVAVHKNQERKEIFTKSTFYVLTNEDIKKNFKLSKKELKVWKNSANHKRLMQFECTLAELAELKHGYEHFLKMKGKVKPVEPPKESIQFVIDVWKPNKFNLMPFDARYEDSSWFAEFAVAQLLGGTVTEQSCAGYDVLTNTEKVQVKYVSLTNNQSKNGNATSWQVVINGLHDQKQYDYLIAFFWEDLKSNASKDLTKATVLILPKFIVDAPGFKYKTGGYEYIKFGVNTKGKYPKNAAIHKFKPFMFTIDHLAELGEIGYEQFYVKYLKEPCEKVLGVEIKNGSDDSNGNQIDLKSKFPIQRKISKRTNQADQRSA